MSSILVLDDRPADRMLLASVLSFAGYDTHEAASGEEALTLARAERPDLIITDILMPTMNGYEFVRELRSDPGLGATPVVFCTANYDEDEVMRLAKVCGVSRLIAKPSDPVAIISTVEEVLGAPRQRHREIAAPVFEREQLRLLNDKLVQKVAELEAANEQRQKLVAQLLHAQDQERQHLAEALHDDSIQAISAVAMQLGVLAAELGNTDHAAILARLEEGVVRTGERLRGLIFELQPVELETQGLSVALQVYLEHVREEDGLEFELSDTTTRRPAEETSRLIYRMAQEALNNVRKHAQASHVDVFLEDEDRGFIVRVRDDGKGFSPEEAMRVRHGHLGLPSMRERLETAGGSLAVSSEPGCGSSIEIRLPDLGRGYELDGDLSGSLEPLEHHSHA